MSSDPELTPQPKSEPDTKTIVLNDTQVKLKKEFIKNGLFEGCRMDDANAEAAAVMMTEGLKAAQEHMFTRADGSTRSYSEMRSMYG